MSLLAPEKCLARRLPPSAWPRVLPVRKGGAPLGVPQRSKYPPRSPPSRAYRVERAPRALSACPCWKARRPGWRCWSSPPEAGGTLGGLLGTGSQEPAAGTAGCACSSRPTGYHPRRLARLQTKFRRRCSRALPTRSRSTSLRPLRLPPPRLLPSYPDRRPCHRGPETRLEGQQEG